MENSKQVVALIPAYKPEPAIVPTSRALLESGAFEAVVCVNDGSHPEYDHLFSVLEGMGVTVLRHAINLGKGTALKTGINFIAVHYPSALGIVTLDADGQHLAQDCVAVAREFVTHPGSLVLGCRSFDTEVPLRSRFGNILTRGIMSFFCGIAVKDTQTGLRAIPMGFAVDLLRLKTSGYDFELDMLMQCKMHNIPINDVYIDTVYIDGNRSSHFNPLWDSMRIYFVFLRYSAISIIAALIDYLVFYIAYLVNNHVLTSLVMGRILASLFQFCFSKSVVFRVKDNNTTRLLIKYAALVTLMTSLAYILISTIVQYTRIPVLAAKFIVEGTLFLIGFALARSYVFVQSLDEKQTQ